MSEEISKIYDSRTVESQAMAVWDGGRYWHAEPGRPGADGAYVIVIPPPNVTAALHLGHALNNTLQDILIRLRRMQGRNTLWMPGTDHAGIATQTVVEKRLLAEQGKRRTDFEREEFVAHVQAWKDEYEARILDQLKSMGCSCDWDRTRFTMDEVCARAVRATFFNLFKDGLIYRGKRLVNWDPATQTVLADDEVEHETVQGHFWYLRYPLVEPVRVEGVSPSVVHTDDAASINKRHGRYLPHWSKEGAAYAVVFRLADSVPSDVSEQWRFQRRDIIERAKSQGRPLTENEEKELQRLYSEKIESFLDSGYGECLLKKDDIAEIMDNALKHFDGERYDLLAWAIMPNHIHIIVKPYTGHKLDEIVHSWKSFTAKEINKRLGRKGSVWMDEYYDHLIRDDNDFKNQVHYVISNPERAGLQNWKWYGGKEDRRQDACDTKEDRGQDACDTKENRGQDACDTKGDRGQDACDTKGDRGQDACDTKEDRGQDACDTIEYVTVATTRPETMLGDTAVAMNPADPRAKALVGKMVRLPIVGRIIPIIADEHVVLPDPNSTEEKAKFSTGFLKVTPAHDPDDWQIGQRHNLPVINVMAPDGSISEKYGWTDWDEIKNPDVENVLGMDRFEAREAIVEWFRQENLLENVRDYTHEVGHSYRSHVPIEPYLSDQWYVAVKKPINRVVGVPPAEQLENREQDACRINEGETPSTLIKGTDVPVNSLAGLALAPLLEGRLKFYPDRYAKTYQTWLENLRDWPISRQLWWGHRIPVWSKKGRHENRCEYGTFCMVAETEQGPMTYACVKPGFEELERVMESEGWVRDADVLDTWFSSALWPFSTLGWPEETAELKTYYPTNVLCTAREIITLWVSRMVMMGQYCVGDIPFRDVYIHAMIQDGQGRKMSKSLGNGIDPLIAIDSHGADAMRFTLAQMTTDTQDVRMPVSELELPDGRVVNSSPKFDIGRSFCNKLWNASRFAMMNLEGVDPQAFDADKLDLTDRWILSRLSRAAAEVTAQLEGFKFSEPITTLYRFFWNDFCDWYLEWAKPRMNNPADKPIAQNVLAFVLDQILRLLHPFIPFITEGIYQALNQIAPGRTLKGIADLQNPESIMVAPWPRLSADLIDPDVERRIEMIQNATRAIREIRSKYAITPAAKLDVSVNAPGEAGEILTENRELVCSLAGINTMNVGTNIAKPKTAAAAVVEGTQVFVHDVIDPEAERKRLMKQKEFIENGIRPLEAKLGNENFVSRAKPEVVEQSRRKLEELTGQLNHVNQLLAELE